MTEGRFWWQEERFADDIQVALDQVTEARRRGTVRVSAWELDACKDSFGSLNRMWSTLCRFAGKSSVCSRATTGRFKDSSAWMAAMSSMRLLVVAPGSPPYCSFSCLSESSTAPQPPGPGVPLQAPSV